MAAFRICEAHSEGVVVLIANYCDDSSRAQPMLTATLDFLVDFTIRLASLSTDRRSAIVELAVNTASENITEAHRYVKVKLSEKQFEYQVTAAISEVWESVVPEVEEAGLPLARDLASIAEGDESLREANDALTQQVERLTSEKEQQSAFCFVLLICFDRLISTPELPPRIQLARRSPATGDGFKIRRGWRQGTGVA